jgi:hypothetical protein
MTPKIKLLLLLLAIFLFLRFQTIKEGFHYPPFRMSYCDKCGDKGEFTCGNCANCGFCIDQFGFGECVPGDQYGPFFREDCVHWQYMNPGMMPWYSPYRWFYPSRWSSYHHYSYPYRGHRRR